MNSNPVNPVNPCKVGLIMLRLTYMEKYEFITTWRLDAPLELVWEAIYHSEQWPEWWPGLMSVVELEKGDDSGIGNLRRYSWQGVLPYKLVFDMCTTRIDRPTTLAGTASGDLEGTGLWSFSEEGKGTVLSYDWRVVTRKGWMNLLAPIGRPLFRWNHDQVMLWGRIGLERLLAERSMVFGLSHN